MPGPYEIYNPAALDFGALLGDASYGMQIPAGSTVSQAVPFVNAPAASYIPTINAPAAPNAPIGGGRLGALGIANIALSGLQTLGSLWMANKANKLAKKQFNFTKDITETNLANQMQTYNTALADRARSRGVMEGQTAGQVTQYVDANSLTRDRARSGGSSVRDITAAALANYNTVNPDRRRTTN